MDVAEIKATISTALAERSALPPYEKLCCLHEALLGHIKALMPLAEKQIDGLWRGSREWYRKRATFDSIPYEVDQGLGGGLCTAIAHVKSLGYTLRFLLENAGLADVGGGSPSHPDG
ncbi:DUF6415 family natural product biosynthesis protein [Streptomyces sp. WMMB303]|uniref:DUF6415 family natural product biosynthesis protein n=1 Tax=Streptomyces sp. WMMB303 TaxID=3034154 RepID=UPI0023EC85F2|nr:DUF6415 family natural product biosynthesis protein [Streptomyces sp. WMMB303]MDF4251414.1 DUF6415 family natural product biosynthesis protein [Streptomyces sp. WMMB303]